MQTLQTKSPQNRPVQKFMAGNIRVAVWENQTGEGKKFPMITIDRIYKDGEEWKKTASFRRSDLLRAAFALQKASEFLEIKHVHV